MRVCARLDDLPATVALRGDAYVSLPRAQNRKCSFNRLNLDENSALKNGVVCTWRCGLRFHTLAHEKQHAQTHEITRTFK